MVLEEEVKVSVVSELSILPYTQNRTLENLRKFSFASSFERVSNLDAKTTKKLTDKKNLKIKICF